MPTSESSPADIRLRGGGLHGVLFIAMAALTTAVPSFRAWPWVWLAPLAAYSALVALLPPLRASFRPWRFGNVSTAVILATLLITLGSCGVLIAFHRLAEPDMTVYRGLLPISQMGGVLVAGILFSILNALFEELIFRGVLFDAVDSQWGRCIAIIATALLFGYGHMRGYPPGPLGAVLATIYGLCLGWLRSFTRGLGLPILAHIAADATIFTLMARSGVFQNPAP